MSGIILFKCRSCDGEISLEPHAAEDLHCPHCQTLVPMRMDPSLQQNSMVEHCISCGHDTLYIQKDFNRMVGLVLVAVGSLVALFFFSRSQPLYAMIALVVMAAIDFMVYRLVSDVTVCYACHAIYRGFVRNPRHEPFDLKDLEKYGGRDPRF